MSSTHDEVTSGPSVSDVAFGILADSAPRPTRRHMRNVVSIGQRWRRRRDGQVVIILQVHRADRQVECFNEGEALHRRYVLGFRELRVRYELLVTGEAFR